MYKVLNNENKWIEVGEKMYKELYNSFILGDFAAIIKVNGNYHSILIHESFINVTA